MNIVLDQNDNVELARGERVGRGQNKSRYLFVNWLEGASPGERTQDPIPTGQLAVEVNITRPDGEQSGWQLMQQCDNQIKFYYLMQAWDTAVAGKAWGQVRWYNATEDPTEDTTTIYTSAMFAFIVDNGVIAQPLPVSNENYSEIVSSIVELENRAFKKYNSSNLPFDVDFSTNGKKNAPAMYYNFVNGSLSGTLFVTTNAETSIIKQTEFLLSNGDIYLRLLRFNAEEYNGNEPGTPVEAINSNEEFINISEVINNLQTGKVDKASIVDNLLSSDNTKVLSAKQGKMLDAKIDEETTALHNKIDARTKVYFTADEDGYVYANYNEGE